MRLVWIALFGVAGVARAAPPPKQLMVVCSPGSVGTAADAQPALDTFTAAISAKSGVPVAAAFEETEAGGVAHLRQAGLALVSLPFFLAHERELGLHARLVAVPAGRPDLDRWTLVAKAGRVPSAAALDGMTIYSNAAFAPAFVRGSVLGRFGKVPASAKVVQSTSVLSALRRAANGEPVAVVLDGAQQAALATLPYAAQLQVVATSPAMPAGIVATVDARVPDKTWPAIAAGLRALPADALAAVRMARFTPVDEAALGAARAAFEAAR